jgi:hypothetical protein
MARVTAPRRTMQQIIHCCVEALSAWEHNEDPRHIRDDLDQARQLIDIVLRTVSPMAAGAKRADVDGDEG